jgi:hypothetical protein
MAVVLFAYRAGWDDPGRLFVCVVMISVAGSYCQPDAGRPTPINISVHRLPKTAGFLF